MFVEMYGVPAYGEIDPTFFVALTYSVITSYSIHYTKLYETFGEGKSFDGPVNRNNFV